jgi:dihydroxyacetone kinase-like protein
MMKKIINNPENFVDEMIEGITLAHPDLVRTPGADLRILVRADAPLQGKVGIVTGGGSGHLPLFKGYVGRGLCSAVAIGNVFSSPSSQQIFEATMAVDGGAGVLYLYGNYGGDVFNFDLAADLAELEDVETHTVLGRDDVASQPKERAADRRGVAGIMFAYKAAGAAAERGDSLAQVAAVAEDITHHPADDGEVQFRPAGR